MIGGALAVVDRRAAGAHLDLGDLADCIAPGLVFAQAIGRWGNWFNQELFGGPSTLPWALEIDRAHRPAGYAQYATFQPTFLYESLYCLALGFALLWVDHQLQARRRSSSSRCTAWATPPARFVFEEMRIDPAHTIGPLRVNAWVSIVVFVVSRARGSSGSAATARRPCGPIRPTAAPTDLRPWSEPSPRRLHRRLEAPRPTRRCLAVTHCPRIPRRRPTIAARAVDVVEDLRHRARPRSARSTTSSSSSAPRQFTAIMGPSGSGKSTLLHCLAGLDRVTSGQIYLGDVEISALEREAAHAHPARPHRVRVPGVQPDPDAQRARRTSRCRCRSRAASPTRRGSTRSSTTRPARRPAQAPPERALGWSAAARRGRRARSCRART